MGFDARAPDENERNVKYGACTSEQAGNQAEGEYWPPPHVRFAPSFQPFQPAALVIETCRSVEALRMERRFASRQPRTSTMSIV